MWKRAVYLLGGLLLLIGGIVLLEAVYPREEKLPPIRPVLERVDERQILIDGGLIDQLRFEFGDERTVESVDDVYRCLERELDEAFGDNSVPQGNTRWSRRMAVGERLRKIEELCVD